ncbi:hypothetical protein HDU96_005392 [Phlyctochytrium bullatum]|nr:hypothetical protein HDU96_005392 [Phlyctochytrium bullatum]
MKVATWAVAGCATLKPTEFEELVHQESDDAADHLQVTHIVVPNPAPTSHDSAGFRYLKIILKRGHWDFASVHRITVQGEVLAGETGERDMDERDEKA